MAENRVETDEQKVQPPVLSVGAILRIEREARGLSVEEIAERVKYSVRQVEALEQDDVERLPQGTFLRGFVRSYARVLGMDEAALLAATHTRTTHHFDVEDVQSGGAPLPISGDAGRRSRYLLLGALAVTILLAVFLLMPAPDSSLPNPAQTNDKAGVMPASAASVVSPPTKPSEPTVVEPKAEPEKVKPKIEPVANSAATPRPPVAQPLMAATPELATPVASTKPETPLVQLMKRPIHVVFEEEAWMEIIDVNGEILLSRVTQAGDEKWIGGGHRAPYSVTIARPGAIRMYYHGKPVDLSQFNPAQVAKLVLE